MKAWKVILIAFCFSLLIAGFTYWYYSRYLHPILKAKTAGDDRKEYIKALEKTARNIGVSPSALWLVINSESGHNPAAINSYTNAHVGLIQFSTETAASLGTNIVALRAMSRINQLAYVEAFYKIFKQPKNYIELYLTTFYPYALGKDNDYVFGSEVSPSRVAAIAAQNPFDGDGSGSITMKEFKKFARRQIVEGVFPWYLEFILF